MKLLVLFASLSLSQPVFAGKGFGASFYTSSIGGTVTVGPSIEQEHLPEELSDWVDPSSQSTSRLDSQCGVLTEMKLVRNGRLNFLFLGLRNESSKAIVIRMDRVRANFGDGRERILVPAGNAHLEVKHGWYTWGFLPFPRKADFKNQNSLNVTVPLVVAGETLCDLQVTFHRNIAVPEDQSSLIEAGDSVMSIGLGTILGATKGLTDITDPYNRSGPEIYLGRFHKADSGAYVRAGVDEFGKVLDANAFKNRQYGRVRMTDMSFGKTWRRFYGENTAGYFNLGPSLAMWEAYIKDERSDRDSKFALGIYGSYTYEWRYARVYVGGLRGDYSLGLSIYTKYYPYVFDVGQSDVGILGATFDFLRIGY